MNVLLVDNYDSFTYNLYDYVLQSGAQCQVIRNDAFSPNLEEVREFDAILLSPGPKKPADAGALMAIIERFHREKPILGVCLGHQALGIFFGAHLKKAAIPVHGKTSLIKRVEHPIFAHTPPEFAVMRYHSLIIAEIASTPLMPLAHTQDGELMAFAHESLPLTGVQFHPESILTAYGHTIINNWVAFAGAHIRSKTI